MLAELFQLDQKTKSELLKAYNSYLECNIPGFLEEDSADEDRFFPLAIDWYFQNDFQYYLKEELGWIEKAEVNYHFPIDYGNVLALSFPDYQKEISSYLDYVKKCVSMNEFPLPIIEYQNKN